MNTMQQPEPSPVHDTSDTCRHCGAALTPSELFCTQCGTPRGEKKTEPCPGCGEKLTYGQKFCPRCGKKRSWKTGVKMNLQVQQSKCILKVIGVLLVVCSLIAACVILALQSTSEPAPELTVSELCAEGRYAEAYEKAEAEDRRDIWLENSVAYLSAGILHELEQPEAFELKAAYWLEKVDSDGSLSRYILFEVFEQTKYGYPKSNRYWVFEWVFDYGEWSEIDSDESEAIAASVKQEGAKLRLSSTKRINTLFEKNLLENIELLTVDEE